MMLNNDILLDEQGSFGTAVLSEDVSDYAYAPDEDDMNEEDDYADLDDETDEDKDFGDEDDDDLGEADSDDTDFLVQPLPDEEEEDED